MPIAHNSSPLSIHPSSITLQHSPITIHLPPLTIHPSSFTIHPSPSTYHLASFPGLQLCGGKAWGRGYLPPLTIHPLSFTIHPSLTTSHSTPPTPPPPPTHLELFPQFDVHHLCRGTFVVPGAHLVDVGGRLRVRDAEDLLSKTSNERHRSIDWSVAWNGNGC